MKRLTITVDTNEHAAELEKLLNKLEYVVSVEDENISGNLSAEEESFVKERIEHYNANKKEALSFEQFSLELKKGMVYKLIISPLVLNDVDEAYQWYEEQQTNSGKQFVIELQKVIALVSIAPELFIEIKPKIRRALLQGFPYNLYFKIEMDEIIILGIMHQKRNPSTIKKRFK